VKRSGLQAARELDGVASPVQGSDESLIARARIGDRGAFAELWRRHARSGIRVARQFTSSIDADDLVAEAYTRIYGRVLAGGGPVGAFRPYLYTTIRNLASRWGQANREVQVDDIDDFEDPRTEDDPVGNTLDRTLTADAFRTLPERWQAVLWYTEVEGMDPHEVAPLLGLSANGVAALSYRAREGLRKAWLQAHISGTATMGECGWVVARLGDYTRNGLTEREQRRVDAHLEGCAKCSLLSQEVDEVGSQLAMVLLPLLFGATVGGSLLAAFSAPTAATAAQRAVGPV
jgi:RNA polymerase sigma factor (sigma-70 family)